MRAISILAVLAACSHPPVGELRYRNQPAVWRVNDRAPIAKPAERDYNRTLYHTDGFFVRRATRAMDVRVAERARDVNALDEVPDSTWFTNRIGTRELSLDELRTGPNTGSNPFDHLPWKIVGGKIGGTALGFWFVDTTGDRYLIKFDTKDTPELETATHAVVLRILWACGYNVPEDRVGYIRREDLLVAPDAKAKDTLGDKHPITVAQLEDALSRVHRETDGRIRVLASKFVPGKPVGPYAREGTRDDDPNDVIPHEARRSLRGQRTIYSWLDHTDIQEDQTLDVFVDGGYLVHYMLDFGKALGVMGISNHWKTVGHTYRLDLGMAVRSLVTFGLWERPWDPLEPTGLRGIGLYDAATYTPDRWRPNSMYWPFEDADRFDGYWGAKLVMRFTRDQLAAIIEEGQYTDPRSARYLLDTMVARQRMTARHWFAQVSPLDRFAVESGALCFDDLALAYGLETAPTRHHAQLFDRDGRVLGAPSAMTPTGARSCVAVPADGYTIVRLAAQRNARRLPAVQVHVAGGAVIGIRRE